MLDLELGQEPELTHYEWITDTSIDDQGAWGKSQGFYIYPGEIDPVTMLGDDKELRWELVKREGLKIFPPVVKPCEHAFTFKIVRKYKN